MSPDNQPEQNKRSCEEILKSLQGKVSMVKQILTGLRNGPVPLKTTNFTNLLIWSRILINETENLKSCDRKKFEGWYAQYRRELFGDGSHGPDPLLDYFIQARNQLEHQGIIKVGWSINIHHLNIPGDLLKYGPAPPGARGFFLGDQLGGIGWLVDLPNGSQAKYYVNLPKEFVESSLLPHNPLLTHLMNNVQNTSVESLAEYYVRYIEEMVTSAGREFRTTN